MTKESGGQAFPIGDTVSEGNTGMTLRDYFAGQVLANVNIHNTISDQELASVSALLYKLADAMIKERSKE